jgi:predicted Abi (CAAX) family protease
MGRRILWLLCRLALATALAFIVMMLPQPGDLPVWLDALWMPAVVFVLLCYIGKLLYDTLFYDHYIP